MKVAVLGPTNIAVVAAVAGFAPGEYERQARAAGAEVARRGAELVVVPDQGVAVYAAQAYREAGGPRLTGLFPAGGLGTSLPGIEETDHRTLCDVLIEDLTWAEQHARICELADVMLAIGLSCGTVGELIWTKWTRVPAVVLRPLASSLPPEVLAEANISFIDELTEFWALAEQLVARRA